MYAVYYFRKLFNIPRMPFLRIAGKTFNPNLGNLLVFIFLWTFGTNVYCRDYIYTSKFSTYLLSELENIQPKEIDAIVIWTKDGKSLSILFEGSPKVSKTPTDIVVKSKQVEVYYPLTDYLKFTFEKLNDDSKVETIFQDNRINFHFSANRVEISNLTPNEIVSVYSVNGMKEFSSKVNSDGKISIFNLSVGIHILKANNTNFKLLIK